MRKAITVLFLMISIGLFATGLNSEAQVIKNNSFGGYSIIKILAEIKWENDHSMILYEINEQSSSAFELLQLVFAEDRTPEALTIFVDALEKWSVEGAEVANLELFLSILKDDNILEFFRLACDWNMVLYEYNNQIESLNSY